METTLNVSEVVYREDLYPRIKPDPATIQRYAENLDVLPPIEVSQHNILIDGFHRWTAHRKAQAETIRATITICDSEAQLYALAIRRNAAHGLQMNNEDKRSSAIRLYAAGTGLSKDEIADVLSVTDRMVTSYLHDVEEQLRAERKQKIIDSWLACETNEDIAESLGMSVKPVKNTLSDFSETLPKSLKVLADFSDSDFTPPLYNVWRFSKLKNDVAHFGNSEQTIVENLLYLYTEPFDIVVDPFAGGGSTIDVCRKRLRRYWCSDRKPIVERENDIRQMDVIGDDGSIQVPPLNKRWSEVCLTYLDPPYWRQAAGKYSDDPTDLANMELEQFTDTLARLVREISQRQSKGVIALLIQPTQWSADDRQYTDHVTDLVRAVGNKRLILENRVSCPYQSEQYNAQQVEWAKANRKLLVLSRELIIWRIAK
jgi:DNA-binding CsgD family transcriptional regulator